jgi:hypothetical protein
MIHVIRGFNPIFNVIFVNNFERKLGISQIFITRITKNFLGSFRRTATDNS